MAYEQLPEYLLWNKYGMVEIWVSNAAKDTEIYLFVPSCNIKPGEDT